VILWPLRWALRVILAVLAGLILYFSVTFVQVWLTARHYDPQMAGAILVMGAAQYNGVPSPDLAARLNEALKLYNQGLSPLVVVTGSKEKGDRYSEAQAGEMYLSAKGVPADRILEAGGSDSYANIDDALPLLESHHVKTVLISTDPFHEDRCLAIASGLGLDPFPTPTQTSPITGWSTVPYFFKEAIGVGLGRVIGFNNLSSLHAALG
jgi:uncharacterized SAM-binding protein YcdF (DUF218 family)